MATNKLNGTILGIDLGTTSVKVCCILNRETITETTEETNADIKTNNPLWYEQSPYKIFIAFLKCIDNIKQDQQSAVSNKLSEVVGLGICGQMHGVVLWKKSLLWEDLVNEGKFNEQVSPLITWQDKRCDLDFLSKLPPPTSNYKLCTGFGCSTLAWLGSQQQIPSGYEALPWKQYDFAGSIMDLMAYLLCKLSSVVTSSQVANSWGYFNINLDKWDFLQIKQAGIPLQFIPEVQSGNSSYKSGLLQVSLSSIPLGVPISLSYGDLQCSVLSVNPSLSDLVINISTSAQAIIILPTNTINAEDPTDHHALTSVPYFNGNIIKVAAALTGGNTIATYVDTLIKWMHDLGLVTSATSINRSEIYTRVIECGLEKMDTSLKIDPVLWGERHNTELQGSVNNIIQENLSIGDISSAICAGVVRNLEGMLPISLLKQFGVKRVLCCGSVFERNKLVLEHTRRIYALPVEVVKTSAAFGAAIAILNTLS